MDARTPSPREPEPTAPAGPAPAGDDAEAGRWDRRTRWVLLVSLVLLLSGALQVGPTFDEHYYVASGVAYWHTGDFALNREHPPLVKLLVGLPLLFAPDVPWTEHATSLVSFPRTWFFQLAGDHLARNLFLARLPICLATVLLAWLVARTARRLFSPRAACFATAAFALDPSVLAHGRLASLDAGLGVFLFLAAVTFARLAEHFSWRRLVAAGLAFGLACLCKFTALVAVPWFLLVALVLALARRSPVPLAWVAGTFAIGLTVFAAGYGFEAKSAAEVGTVEAYFGRRTGESPPPVLPRELAEAARAAGLESERAEEIAEARTARAAVARLSGELLADERGRRAALGAFRALAGAEGDLRRQACAAVLEQQRLDAESFEVLDALAGVRIGTEARWRSWFAANRTRSWDRTLFTSPVVEAATRGVVGDERPIPLLSAIKGLDYQLRHGSEGHGTTFRGEVLPAGSAFVGGNPHPEYYAVTWAVKNPIAFTVAMLLGLAFWLRRGSGTSFVERMVFVGFPVALFATFSAGSALMGVRYLLPIYPFAALWIAGAVQALPRVGAALVLVALVEGAVLLPEAAPSHPNELMYYNAAAGGPVGGPWTTVVGDDWGQDARQVGRFAARYAEPIAAAGGLYYDPYTRADLERIGLGDVRREFDRPRGIVAVHAVDYYRSAERYAWLRDYEPFLRIGWSVWVYDTREPAPGGDPLPAWDEELRER